jgi:hypothetical protein
MPRWRLSIRKNKGYLESKFCPNRRIFVFWRPFWIQNGRHSKLKWSSYGVACLTPCKYPFPFKSFHWEPYYDPSDHIISCYYSSSSFFLSFFRQKFVFHISRRCLDQTLWNLVGISYAMWSCAKNDDDYQFARTKATWKANFAQIGGFLYFGGHFEFKMATIAN